MKNLFVCAVAGIVSLFLFGGCQKPVVESPVLTLETTEFAASADGGPVSVPYELKNATEGSVVSVEPVAEYDWVEVTSVGETAIELSVTKNDGDSERTAEFAVSYPGASADAKFSIVQAASLYDYEWAMTNFNSRWYGDMYGLHGEHNYYTWISDKPFVDDATQPGGTYYLFDIYAGAPSDESAPMIPAGTYTLGKFQATDEWTFSPDFSKAVRYNTEEKEWEVSFKDGTLVVSYEGSTLTMDALLTDTDGKTHHVTYTGEGVCTPNLPDLPGIGKDVDFTPTSASAFYLTGNGSLMEVAIDFTDMDTDSEGNLLPPGTYLTVDAVMPYDSYGNIAPGTYVIAEGSDRGYEYTIYPGENLSGLMYSGSYAQHAVSSSEVLTGMIAAGTMVVESSADGYEITCNFEGPDGYKITCSWSGDISIIGIPDTISTLEGDYTLDLEGATATGKCYGDYYMTGGNNWTIKILPTTGPDGFLADFVTEDGDFSDGIPSGTFTASDWPYPGEFYPGYKSGSDIGGTIYVGGFDDEGYVSEYAPAMSGELTIVNNGDGTYSLSFDFVDDKGNAWDGEWSGPIELTDSETDSISSVDAGSARPVRTMLETNALNAARKKINVNYAVENQFSSLDKVLMKK